MKDKRFSIAAKLIRTNEIKTFSEIIDIVPKTVVAKELGMTERFNRLLATIDLFVVKDLVKLAEVLEVDTIAVLHLVDMNCPSGRSGSIKIHFVYPTQGMQVQYIYHTAEGRKRFYR